jgi:hypothetical protein
MTPVTIADRVDAVARTTAGAYPPRIPSGPGSGGNAAIVDGIGTTAGAAATGAGALETDGASVMGGPEAASSRGGSLAVGGDAGWDGCTPLGVSPACPLLVEGALFSGGLVVGLVAGFSVEGLLSAGLLAVGGVVAGGCWSAGAGVVAAGASAVAAAGVAEVAG